MRNARHAESWPILVSLHHIGELPLRELQRRFGESAVSYARSHKLIEGYPDEGNGQLYTVTGKGKMELGLSRSRKISPELVTAGFIRQVADAYLRQAGFYHDAPDSHRLTNSRARIYWDRDGYAPQYYRVVAALPHPPGATIKRMGFRGEHNLWLFADSARHYRFWENDGFFDPEYLTVTTWSEVRQALHPAMLEAFDRVCKARLGRAFP